MTLFTSDKFVYFRVHYFDERLLFVVLVDTKLMVIFKLLIFAILVLVLIHKNEYHRTLNVITNMDASNLLQDVIEGVPNRGHLSNKGTSSGPNSIN